jgi:hypothetical protein
MTINAVVSQFMGDAESLESSATDIRGVHNSELIASFHEHSGYSGRGIRLPFHHDVLARGDFFRVYAETFYFHLAQDETGGSLRQRFSCEAGLGLQDLSFA